MSKKKCETSKSLHLINDKRPNKVCPDGHGCKCYHQSKTKIVISWKMPEASSSIKKGDFKIFSNYRKMYYVYLTSAAVTLCVFRVGMRENLAVTKNCLAAEFK